MHHKHAHAHTRVQVVVHFHQQPVIQQVVMELVLRVHIPAQQEGHYLVQLVHDQKELPTHIRVLAEDPYQVLHVHYLQQEHPYILAVVVGPM